MKSKIIYSVVFCSLAFYASGQIAIGKKSINGNSTILDFDDTAGSFRGIILPSVENTVNALASNATYNNGTFLFDKSDKKLKMYEAGNWKSLSEEGKIDDLIINDAAENKQGQGVIIGEKSSSAKGILVLESVDKAIILPKIDKPHETVNSPYPGMMCYDTESKSVAIFDGKVWNYWK